VTMKSRIIATVTALFLFSGSQSNAQQEPPLIRLTKQALSPQMRATARGITSDRENNLTGWLVLNGARFRNSEYPALAKSLAETYAQQGLASNSDADFTELPFQPSEADPHGQIVRGWAICPTPALCGDLVGSLAAFDLDASL
jgi:hypothetical protein